MEKKRILVAVLTAVLTVIPLAGHAEEELFDTKAAAKHLEQGVAYMNAKNLDAAIREFEESAGMNPEAEAFYYLGYAYYLKGRNGDADSRAQSLENFDKAYELDPNFSPTRYKPGEPAPAAAQNAPTQLETPAPPAPQSAQALVPEAPQQEQPKQ